MLSVDKLSVIMLSVMAQEPSGTLNIFPLGQKIELLSAKLKTKGLPQGPNLVKLYNL